MRVLLTGSDGLVGSAIKRHFYLMPGWELFCDRDYNSIVKSAYLPYPPNLTKDWDVKTLYRVANPDVVIHTAAKVGGVQANLNNPATFFYDNIMMNTLMLKNALECSVKKFICFSSVCAFPDGIPLLEENLMHQGEPYKGNAAYAHSKRMADVYIEALKTQYKIENYCSVIPGNIFGLNDNFNLTNGHVVPALIHKTYLAKINNVPLKIWGNGKTKREFLFADDVAQWILQLLKSNSIPQRIIMSGQEQFAIEDIVKKICKAADYKHEPVYDLSKPNGQGDRPSSKVVLDSVLPDRKITEIDKALELTYDWFAYNYHTARK